MRFFVSLRLYLLEGNGEEREKEMRGKGIFHALFTMQTKPRGDWRGGWKKN